MPLAAMGVQPDPYKYLDTLAKLYDMPELRTFVPQVQEAQPPQERTGGSGKLPQPGKPNGNYTRNNVSRGMTPEAEQQQQAMMLMGGGGNNNQGAA